MTSSNWSTFFWSAFILVIVTLALITGYLTLRGAAQVSEQELPPQDVFRVILQGEMHLPADKLPSLMPTLQASLDNEIQRSQAVINQRIDQQVDVVFQQIDAQVPQFTAWYYSLPAEYTRYAHALLGDMSEYLSDRLQETVLQPANVEQQLDMLTVDLNQQLQEEFATGVGHLQETLQQFTQQHATPSSNVQVQETLDLQTVFQDALTLSDDDLGRLTIASLAAAGVGATVAKGLGVAVVKNVVAKIVGTNGFKLASALLAKFAAKTAVKGGGAGAAAAAGTLVCSPTGAAALACGAVAGVATWIAVDAVIIEFDSYLNEERFTQEIRTAVMAERDELKTQMKAAYQRVIEAYYYEFSKQFEAALPTNVEKDFVPAESL